jgi:hypothetical protein
LIFARVLLSYLPKTCKQNLNKTFGKVKALHETTPPDLRMSVSKQKSGAA